MTRWRKVKSSSVGGMADRQSAGGRKQVLVIARGVKTSRAQKLPAPSPAMISSASPEQNESRIGVLGTAFPASFREEGEGRLRAIPRGRPILRRGERSRASRMRGPAACVGLPGVARCRRLRLGQSAGRICTSGRSRESCSLLVQEHGHGSGGDHLGDTGQIVDGGRGDRLRRLVVGKAADAIECEHLAFCAAR